MKKQIFTTVLLLMAAYSLYTQQNDYRVIFDMSTRDSVSQLAVLREVELIRRENPASRLGIY